jgi:hypothetical protein
MQQRFLEDVFPYMTPEMLRLAYKADEEYEKTHPSQDFGLDLHEMEMHYLGEKSDFYPDRLIPKNHRVVQEGFNIKEMRNKETDVHPSLILEGSLFGSKAQNKEPVPELISSLKTQSYNQKNVIPETIYKARKEYNNYKMLWDGQGKFVFDKIHSNRGREHLVVERILGVFESKLYLKNWVINKGKGSMRVSRMFRRAIHESHRKHDLPKKVRESLTGAGPRIGVLGYGIKH